jgi:hypothetical protein
MSCERALALHRGGQLGEAAALYREVLASEPAHFGALHLLGVIEGQRSRYAEAVALIEHAIRVDSGVAAARQPRQRPACARLLRRGADELPAGVGAASRSPAGLDGAGQGALVTQVDAELSRGRYNRPA